MDLLSYTSTFSAIQLLGVLCYTGELKESIGVRGSTAPYCIMRFCLLAYGAVRRGAVVVVLRVLLSTIVLF